MNIAICTPHGGNVRPEWQRSISTMLGHNPSHQFIYVDVDMMIIGKARNMCVVAAKEMDADLLWFIDDDVIVPADAGILIDQAMALGIVSGLYFSRRPPYTPQAYTLAEEEHNKGMYWPMIDYPKDQLVQADAVGAGCLLVTMEIIKEMEKHFTDVFSNQSEKVDHAWLSFYIKKLSPWFEFLDAKGEDFYFCERVKELDYDIWVNTAVKCIHLGDLPVGEEHFQYLVEHDILQKHDIGVPK